MKVYIYSYEDGIAIECSDTQFKNDIVNLLSRLNACTVEYKRGNDLYHCSESERDTLWFEDGNDA